MEIIGHQKQREFLKRITETKQIGHAYLFSGQEKLGKKTIALEWISLLFGQPSTSLLRKLVRGQHPDFILIEPEKEKKEIQISQIRNLIWKLSLKPYLAPLKATIIDQAHSMNWEAQSAFLKTLEEPRGDTLLILITEYPYYLLSTILSRVETIKFYPVIKEEIKNYLRNKNIPEKETEEIARLSLGKPGRAIDFVLDSERLKDFHQKIKELNQISNSDLNSRFQYAKILSEDFQNLKETLDIWLSYFRNILFSLINQEKNFVSQYSLLKLKNILKQIQTVKFLISTTNVNPRLALETLMLQF